MWFNVHPAKKMRKYSHEFATLIQWGLAESQTGGMISPPQRLRGIEKDSDHFPLATGHGPFYLVKL